MIKSSPWIKLLPPLALASAACMAGAAALLLAEGGGGLALVLVCAALFLLLAMMLAYQRAGDLRRIAEAQAARHERNQQAILRLLDGLAHLAAADLTGEAPAPARRTGAVGEARAPREAALSDR